MTLPSPPPSQPDTMASTASIGPAGNMTWSHLNLIDQLLHEKDRLLRDKDETVRSKTELWRESYDALRKRDEEVNEHRNRISELEGALRARDEEIARRKALTRELHAKYASAKSKYRKLARAFDEHMDECDPDEDVEEHERKSTVAEPVDDADDDDTEEVIELYGVNLQMIWYACLLIACIARTMSWMPSTSNCKSYGQYATADERSRRQKMSRRRKGRD